MFDGVRLNNGIYRQGPNQYFFTVDTGTLESLQVMREVPQPTLGRMHLVVRFSRRYLSSIRGAGGGFGPGCGVASGRPMGKWRSWRTRGGLTELGRRALWCGVSRCVQTVREVVLNPADGEPSLVPRFEESVDHPNERTGGELNSVPGFESLPLTVGGQLL